MVIIRMILIRILYDELDEDEDNVNICRNHIGYSYFITSLYLFIYYYDNILS